MEYFRSKMAQGGEENRKPNIVNLEASDGRELASPPSLRSLQEKIDRNTQETSTQVSQILQKLESLDKELAAAKTRDNLTREMLQIDVLDNMRDAIGELKNDVGVFTGDLQTNKDNTFSLLYELWVLRDNVKTVTQNLLELQQKEDLQDATLEDHMLDMLDVGQEMREVREEVRGLEFRREELSEARDQVTELWDEMYEVREKVYYLERQGDEMVDVEPALESLQDELNNVKNELKSVKDVGKDVMCELNNVKEELRVVKEKTRGANVGQKEMVTGVPEILMYELQKVTNEVSYVKHDLREVSDELAMGVGGRLRNVRRELKSIRHEMRAANHEQRELANIDLNLNTEFNDTIRSAEIDYVPDQAQNVTPALDDLRDTFREGTKKVINKKKRKQDSRHPITLDLLKRFRSQSNDRDEHGPAASVPSASAVRVSASSSDSS